tara:strand:+ start:1789 stop:2259 length:471 start_codon:yes stop_codon:yes gene_type:complete
MKVVNPDGVSAFTCTLVNSVTNATKTYRLFDATGIVSSVTGTGHVTTVTYTVGSAGGPTEESTLGNPIVLSGFNYQVSSDNSQFANNFDIIRCSIDGRQVTHPNIIQKARRNTQFDSKLLTIQERVVIDGQTAFQIVVGATETVTLTFFVEGFLKG